MRTSNATCRVASHNSLTYTSLMARNSIALIICLVVLTGTAAPLSAQGVPLETPAIGSSGEAFHQSIRFRGIDTDVIYYDPGEAPPSLDPRRAPPPPETRQSRDSLDFETVRLTSFVVAAAVVLLIAYLFVRYGGRLPVSFSRRPEEGSKEIAHSASHANTSSDPAPTTMDAILAIRDRREALVALCRHLLASIIAAQGILFQRSWTDRDALRRVPAQFSHLDDLRSLVFASEKVQFGGRDVTEEEFQDHLNRLRPLWGARPT